MQSGDTVQYLLESVDDDKGVHLLKNTPLHLAALKGKMATALSLLENGFSLSDTDDVGNTALHLSAASHSLQTTELLLSFGADPTVRNRFNLTPVEIATNPAIVTILQYALATAKTRERRIETRSSSFIDGTKVTALYRQIAWS